MDLLYCLSLVSSERPRQSPRRRASSLSRGARPRSIVRLLLILVAVVVVVDALIGDQGFLAMRRARRQYDDLTANLARVKTENARLREEAGRLRDDPGAIEDAARRDLHLIRRGERVFILKDVPSPAGK